MTSRNRTTGLHVSGQHAKQALFFQQLERDTGDHDRGEPYEEHHADNDIKELFEQERSARFLPENRAEHEPHVRHKGRHGPEKDNDVHQAYRPFMGSEKTHFLHNVLAVSRQHPHQQLLRSRQRLR